MNKFTSGSALLLLLLLLSSCSSSRKVSKELDESFGSSPVLEQGFHGFMLYDPEEAKILYQHNAEKYFTPASNTKLFTFYTGLKTLGDSIPGIRYTVQGDSLYFWATGDPSLLHQDFPDSRVFDFLKEREEELVFVSPSYTEEHFGPGWAWSDYNWYYSPERGAFPVYGNYVTFEFDPDEATPGVSPSFFANSLDPVLDPSGNSSVAYRDRMANRFEYRHRRGNRGRTQHVPYVYSTDLAVKLLQDSLQRKISIKEEVPAEFGPSNTLYSIPSDSLYKPMLQRSDNFFAEQILLMSAGSLSDTLKSDIAIDYMMERHLRDLPDEPQWVDGSGLSRYNLFTPRTMVSLLEKISEEVPQERLFQLLPAGGVSGTLRNLYKGEEPYVFAKTGTLNNNHSLSGFIKTRRGKTFIFSFMNSNYVAPTSEVKKEMEHVLKTIHQNY